MKINVNNFKSIFFTSDWHLGHNKDFLFEPRGCTDREDHVNTHIEKVNAQAGPEDLIIHIGDVSLSSKPDELAGWFNRINCKNFLSITGNHENTYEKFLYTHGEHFKQNKSLGPYQELTIIEPSEIVGKKAKRTLVVLCHFPFQIWNKMQHGSIHLCGHSHGSFEETHYSYPVSKRLDCGVENALEWSRGEAVMFHWSDIKLIMNKKSIFKGDHHDRNTT